MNQSRSKQGVCKTAKATLGLLNNFQITFSFLLFSFQQQFSRVQYQVALQDSQTLSPYPIMGIRTIPQKKGDTLSTVKL